MAAHQISWPAWLRRGPNRHGATTSPLRDERTAAILGVALGVTFTVCFLTGLFSHWAQSTDPIIDFPARPAGLYRVTQATHILTGVTSIPLLFAKLWTVLPKFFELPPVRSVAHALERLALLPLVGGGLFLLVSGVNNVAAWYPWEFGFVAAHYWAAWITIGGLVVHIGSKIATTRHALRRGGGTAPPEDTAPPSAATPPEPAGDDLPAHDVPAHDVPAADAPVEDDRELVGAGLSRRGFIGVVGGTGVLLGGSVASQSIAPLEPIGFLSPRDLDLGPQGFPVNSSARRRGVVDAAMDPGYQLRVTGNVSRELTFSLDELSGLDLQEAELPITCVEGWSKSARWRGVRLRDLLAMAGAADGSTCTVFSLQESGGFRSSFVNRNHASDRDTLLALEINGEPLHVDHGFPVRLIAPNRPGVNQTKWVREVRVA